MERRGTSGWLVACLCAEWCGTCRGYRQAFEREAQAAGVACAWVDIEDDPGVVGALEVDSFPTLLIARGGEVAFFGTVTPHPSTLARLLRSATAGELTPAGDRDVAALAGRVAELLASA